MLTSQKTLVNELPIEMYVSELDTPFLFQGFYIRDEHDIEVIGEHCKHVFINSTKSNSTSVPVSPTAYFFAMTAVDLAGKDSAFSSEVVKVVLS
jgi:hypothetical protein